MKDESAYRYENLLALLFGAAALVWAWVNAFFPEDAFIFFRYARNLSEGYGAVWNPHSPPVEGYSSFLWMALLSLLFKLGGKEPFLLIQLLGAGVFAGILALSYRLLKQTVSAYGIRLLAFGVIAFHPPLYLFSLSGMETGLFSFLILLCASLFWFEKDAQPIVQAIALSALLLCRYEGFLLAGIFVAISLWMGKTGTKKMLAVLGMALLPVAVWLVWKGMYYGSLLPATFFAKTANPSLWVGMKYIAYWLLRYALAGLVIVLAGIPILLRKKQLLPDYFFPIVLLVLSWMLYLIAIGGDYMEFRMMAPLFPFVILGITGGLGILFKTHSVFRPVFLGIIGMAGFLQTPLWQKDQISADILSFGQMKEEVWNEKNGTVFQGKALQKYFGSDSSLVVMTGTCGAIPFFWNVTFVDASGLNDPEIAKNGRRVSHFPGHHISPTWQQVIDRKVNLIYSRVFRKEGTPLSAFPFSLEDHEEIRSYFHGASLPLKEAEPFLMIIRPPGLDALQMMYVFPHPGADSFIREGKAELMYIRGINTLEDVQRRNVEISE